MDMYWVVLTGIPSTYPAFASKWNIGFALTARHFCQTATKVPKKALPHRTAFAALRFPHSGPAPWARRHGPSMAHRGSPGIHAGRPTPQNLHSASRRASKSKADQKQIKRRSKAFRCAIHTSSCQIIVYHNPCCNAGSSGFCCSSCASSTCTFCNCPASFQ